MIMSTLRLHRESSLHQKFASWEVIIDGKKIGTLADGQAQQYELDPGEHKVLVRWGSISSEEISLVFPPANSSVLECGVKRSSLNYLVQFAILLLIVTALGTAVLLIAPDHMESAAMVLFAVMVVAAGVIAHKDYRKRRTPGGMYYLREKTAQASGASQGSLRE